jgi:hypothetical protein
MFWLKIQKTSPAFQSASTHWKISISRMSQKDLGGGAVVPLAGCGVGFGVAAGVGVGMIAGVAAEAGVANGGAGTGVAGS